MISKQLTNPTISVIIVNYNVKDFLFQCLKSLETAFTDIDGEVIVVDNNSLDSSVEYLVPLFPDVQFIALKENLGFGKANNLGFSETKGKYLLCLNPDTLVSEETLKEIVSYMESHSEVGLAGCKLLNADGSFQLACRRSFPSPWVSFTKIFGLQNILPKSKIFGRYNLTFLDENLTYYVEAVSGAFMFMRREVLNDVKGFDADFFMYGEDLDLCFRIIQAGWKISYVHSTSVIHYKGESTRRSSVKELRVFHNAMEIFAQKHFSSSKLFLIFLRIGISLRLAGAFLFKHWRQALLVLLDIVSVNVAMLLSAKIRSGLFLSFPSYAYPTVFFVFPIVVIISMILAGEYSSQEPPSARKSTSALMLTFFVLSTLTYFFQTYAFSRLILVMAIAFSVLLTAISRLAISIYEKIHGKYADMRIVIVGVNGTTERLIKDLESAEARLAPVVGIITTEYIQQTEIFGKRILGSISLLSSILEANNINEVIITDTNLPRSQVLSIINEASKISARFRFADGYDEVIASRIIERFTGISSSMPVYNISLLKYRFIKRIIDIVGSVFLLSIGMPVVYLASENPIASLKKILTVLFGKNSLFGLYPTDDQEVLTGKIGLTGLAHINESIQLSKQAIRNLNEYYAKHYSLSLDFEIFIKFFLQKKRGSNKNTD